MLIGSRFALLLHKGDGAGTPVPTHGSRYEQVGIGTFMPELSAVFSQPLPALAVDEDETVNVGGGNVGIGPVAVYVGKSVAAPALEIDVGGQANDDENVAGIEPAPEPPVCHAWRGGCHGAVLPQTPSADRGSLGIQPSWRPSE